MLSGTTLNPSTARIATFWQSNEAFLKNAALKVASGRQVRHPSDGIGDYFRADKIRRENNLYQSFQRSIMSAQALLDAAEQAGTFVVDDLYKMKTLVKDYRDLAGNAVAQAGVKAQFDATAAKITEFVNNGALYGGKRLITDTGNTPLASVNLDPDDISRTLDIHFTAGDVADPSGLDIADAGVDAALGAVMEKATSYMAKVVGYKRGLAAQESFISAKLLSNASIEEQTVRANDAAAMSAFSDHNTKQQFASAMLAQILMSQRGVLNLFA